MKNDNCVQLCFGCVIRVADFYPFHKPKSATFTLFFLFGFLGLNLVGTQPGGNLGNWGALDYPDIFPR